MSLVVGAKPTIAREQVSSTDQHVRSALMCIGDGWNTLPSGSAGTPDPELQGTRTLDPVCVGSVGNRAVQTGRAYVREWALARPLTAEDPSPRPRA